MARRLIVGAALAVAMHAVPASAAEPPGSAWNDVTRLPDFFTDNWQSRSRMLDVLVDVPYTDKARDYVARYKPVTDIPFAGSGCQSPGMPLVQRLGSPLKFFYQPGMIAIYIENVSMTRFIKLNAEHSARPNPTYLGESVGHFEGDTLVVDTVGFVDEIVLQYGALPGAAEGMGFDISKSIFGPHGPNLRLVERMRLLDADTLEIQLTIFDDTVWQKPYVWTPAQIFKRNRGENGWPREWTCSSANVMPFDVEQNRVILRDPVDVLKELEGNKSTSGGAK